MPDPVTAITTGASLAGSAMSASGANKASKIQKQAADAATQLQRDIYNQNREDLAPYRQTGTAAQNRLAYLMGLSPSGQSTSSTPLTREQLVAQLTPKYTTSTNGNWYVNSKGQLVDVSKIHDLESANAAVGLDPTRYNSAYISELANGQYDNLGRIGFTPFQSGNTVDQNGLNSAVDAALAAQSGGGDNGDGQYGSLAKSFSLSDFTKDPAYDFRLSEGEKALNRSAASKGGLLSGAASKALGEYGQNFASNEYNNAYNRFNTNQGNLYNRLAGIANSGMGATNTGIQSAQTYADNTSNINMNLAGQRSDNAIRQANSFGTGLNSIGSTLADYYKNKA